MDKASAPAPTAPLHPADLRDYLTPIWQRKWSILVIVAVVTIGTYLYFDHKPPVYKASAEVFVEASTVDQILFNATDYRDDRTIQNQAALLQTTKTAVLAAKNLKRPAADRTALLGAISARAVLGTDFLIVTAQDKAAQGAADIANAFAHAYLQSRSSDLRAKAVQAKDIAQRQLAALPAGSDSLTQRGQLRAQINQLQIVQALPTGGANVAQPATAPSRAIAPKPGRNAIFAFGLSLLFALGAAFGLERFDRRLKRVDELASAYNTDLLSALPHGATPAASEDGSNVLTGSFKESFRGLRTNLQLLALEAPIQRLMVTSAVPGEGKSTVTRNLALAYFEWGLRVCILDCDLRRPSQAGLLHLEAVERGLTDVLTGQCALDEALIDVPVSDRAFETLSRISGRGTNGDGSGLHASPKGEPCVALLAAGSRPANPQAVLAARQVSELIDELAERFDILLFDTPPLLAVSDAVPLVPQMDGVVVVSRMNLSTRDAARRLADVLDRSHARVLGVVANDLPQLELLGGGYTYYGYRYGSGYGVVKSKHHAAVPGEPVE